MGAIRKYLIPELFLFKGKLLWIALFGLLASSVKGVLPLLLGLLVDDAWKADTAHPEWVWQIPLSFALIWVFVSIFSYLQAFWTKYVTDLVLMKLRRQLMDKYLSMDTAMITQREGGSGGLISRILNDLNLVQIGVHRLSDVVREPFTLIFAAGYLFYIDWQLTLGILLIFLPVTAVARKLAKSLRKYSRHNQLAMEDLTKTIKESLDGAKVVQSFNLESEMQQRFHLQAENFLTSRKKIISREEAGGPISESILGFCFAGVLVYIGMRSRGGEFSFGDFTAFQAAIIMLQDAVKKIQDGFIKLQQGAIAMERFHDVMDAERQIHISPNPKPFPKNFSKIEYRNVSLSYGGENVLKNVNLTVKKGEILALVGSSGSGKSSLVNILERFVDPTEGEVLVDDINIRDFSLAELRQNIGLVSQDVFLFADTVEKNIKMGDLRKADQTVFAASAAANAHDFINKASHQYKTQIGDQGAGFSGGEKQRISIARAIFKDAPILILDEATSALDSESEREVQKGLEILMQGRTSFVIAHRLSTIARADRIVVLKQGRIVEEGKHDELLNLGKEYARFHSLQGRV